LSTDAQHREDLKGKGVARVNHHAISFLKRARCAFFRSPKQENNLGLWMRSMDIKAEMSLQSYAWLDEIGSNFGENFALRKLIQR